MASKPKLTVYCACLFAIVILSAIMILVIEPYDLFLHSSQLESNGKLLVTHQFIRNDTSSSSDELVQDQIANLSKRVSKLQIELNYLKKQIPRDDGAKRIPPGSKSTPNLYQPQFIPDIDRASTSSSFTSYDKSTDHLIVGNPLNNPTCRNALIDKENINIEQELYTHLPRIYNLQPSDPMIPKMVEFLLNRTIPRPQFWGREQLNTLLHDRTFWSGARALVSFDPFWHFPVQLNSKYTQTQKDFQWKRVSKGAGNRGTSERPPFPMEQVHFIDNKGDTNTYPAHYIMDKPFDLGNLTNRWGQQVNNSYYEQMRYPQVAYYHITKCGSTSTKKMLEVMGGTRIAWKQSLMAGYPSPDMTGKRIRCGFTFVRHPIHRFISAYYTIEAMLHFDLHSPTRKEQDKNKTLMVLQNHTTFYDILDDCHHNYSCLHRIAVFVDEFVSNSWKWINPYYNILSSRLMEHVGSISGHFMASYDGWKIDYVGKVEYYEQHWKALSQDIPRCSDGYLKLYWERIRRRRLRMDKIRRRLLQQQTQMQRPRRVRKDGNVKNNAYYDRDNNKSNNQDQEKKKKAMYWMYHTGQNAKYTLNRTLVDAYYAFALNRELYDKLVDYYYQDFVCFGYNMSYEYFMEYILEHDPDFDRNAFPHDLSF